MVIGKFRDLTPSKVRRNIDEAKRAALSLWELGFWVLCHHSNTDIMELWEWPDHEPINSLYLHLLDQVVDALFCLESWVDSPGSQIEFEAATKGHIPVFYRLEDILEWKKNLTKKGL